MEQFDILLVDDHPVVRQGLAHVISTEPGLVVCAEAETADAAVTLAEQLQPALAMVDLSLDGRPDITLIHRLRDICPQMQVLVVSMHDEAVWAPRVLEAGACGYVMKQESSPVLIQRIRLALDGETAVSDAVAAALLKQLTWGRNTAEPEEKPVLGERELQVLQLLGQGHSTRKIAKALDISVKTVGTHREHIKRKLGLRTAADLMNYAVLRTDQVG